VSEKPKRIYVWDLGTRLFHWLLVIAVTVSIYTGNNGGMDEMDIHMLSGYTVLTLIIFRLMWGVVGARYARFTQFLKRPRTLWQYIRALPDRSQPLAPGHNPLGALSVVAMLIVLLAQASSGLFANDDIMIEGPLVHLVSYRLSRELTEWHELNAYFIYGLIALHLAALLIHQLYLRHPLIKAMFTGYQPDQNVAADQDAQNKLPLALALASAAAAVVYVLIKYV